MENQVGWADYLVITVVLLISAAIGIYYRCAGGKQNTTNEYLLADRNMSVIPVAFSLMASFMSAITMLGVSMENYMNGTQFVIINVSYIIGTPFAAFIFLPVFYRLGSLSAYEYLRRRFGCVARYCGLIAFMLQMILYMAVVLYAPALAISAVVGLSKWLSIISVGFVCTFYSTLGGMKAVLWTDLFQSILMFASLILVVVIGTSNAGGITKVWNIANEGSRIEFFNFDPDPTTRHTVWNLAIGGIFVYTSIYGINQAQIQRLLTLRNLKKAQLALFLNWPIVSLLSMLTSFSGLVVYAKYHDCDPVDAKKIASADQILPYFVLDTMGHLHGLTGLFIAGIFSGSLSTVSSALNSLAAVTMTDIVQPLLKKELSDQTMTTITKLLSLGYGILCISLTGLAQLLGGVLQSALTVFSILGGPLMGLYFLGMCTRTANQKGSVAGLFVGIVFSFWISFGANYAGIKRVSLPRYTYNCSFISDVNFTHHANISLLETSVATQGVSFVSQSTMLNNSDLESSMSTTPTSNIFQPESHDILPIYKLSYMWYCAVGFFTVVVVGLILSAITGGCEDVDSSLLSPVYKNYFCSKKQTQENIELNEEKNENGNAC